MSKQPNWRTGDVIITTVPGRGRVPFIAEHDPTARGEGLAGRYEWCYGNADATEYRLATHEDVKTALLDRHASIGREREWMQALIELIPLVRAEVKA